MRFSHNSTDNLVLKFLNLNSKIESLANEEAKSIMEQFTKEKIKDLPSLVFFHFNRLFSDSIVKHSSCFPYGMKSKGARSLEKSLRTIYHYQFESATDFYIHELGIRKEIDEIRKKFEDKSSLNSDTISRTYIEVSGQKSYFRYLIKRNLKVRDKKIIIYLYWNPYGENSIYVKDSEDINYVSYNLKDKIVCKGLFNVIKDFVTKNFNDLTLTSEEIESLNYVSPRKGQKTRRY